MRTHFTQKAQSSQSTGLDCNLCFLCFAFVLYASNFVLADLCLFLRVALGCAEQAEDDEGQDCSGGQLRQLGLYYGAGNEDLRLFPWPPINWKGAIFRSRGYDVAALYVASHLGGVGD